MRAWPWHSSLCAVGLLRSYPVLFGHVSASKMIAMTIAAARPAGVRRGGGGCVIAESFSKTVHSLIPLHIHGPETKRTSRSFPDGTVVDVGRFACGQPAISGRIP